MRSRVLLLGLLPLVLAACGGGKAAAPAKPAAGSVPTAQSFTIKVTSVVTATHSTGSRRRS